MGGWCPAQEPGVPGGAGSTHRQRLLAAASVVSRDAACRTAYQGAVVDLRSVTAEHLDDVLEAAAELQRAAS